MSFFGNLNIRIDKRLPANIIAFQHHSGRTEMFRLVQIDDTWEVEQLTQQEVQAVMLGVNKILDIDTHLRVVEGVTYLQEIQQALIDGRLEHVQKFSEHFRRLMESFNASTRASTSVSNRPHKHL